MSNGYNFGQADTLSPEMFAQQQDLNRQQRMAQMLMQQGQQTPQGQMISGRYVPPSIFQNLASLAQTGAGAYLQSKGDEKAIDLAKQLREQGKLETQRLMNVWGGTPESQQVTEMAGPYTGNVPMPTATQTIPARPGDARLAFSEALNMNSPQARALLPKLAEEAFKKPKWEKAEYTDEKTGKTRQGVIDVNSPNPISTFQVGGVKPEMSAAERATLNMRAAELRFQGVPVGGIGGGNVAPVTNVPATPLKTIAPGSPILAPGQQVAPQQNVNQALVQEPMPRFNTKAEQDVWIATQKESGKAKADAMSALPAAQTTVLEGLNAIEGLIGDTTVDSKGKIVYGKTKPHPGFHGAVGASGIGSGFGAAGFIPGTDTTDFKTRFGQVQGQSFLGAINTLRGTGQITEIEGAKATAAINRMSLAQSEVEFVRAANDFKDALNRGYKAAQQRAGVAPINLNATPPSGNLNVKLRYNPQTGTFE
jgi:hypothetical protein